MSHILEIYLFFGRKPGNNTVSVLEASVHLPQYIQQYHEEDKGGRYVPEEGDVMGFQGGVETEGNWDTETK